MTKYFKYKNIEVYRYWNTWRADYIIKTDESPTGIQRIPLVRACAPTKAKAYEMAKQNVDTLNEEVTTWQM